ncbi:Uncharacterised protein [Vibrio cholerae]|nr:Uncharacterised protein [Vibrio cholerae]
MCCSYLNRDSYSVFQSRAYTPMTGGAGFLCILVPDGADH